MFFALAAEIVTQGSTGEFTINKCFGDIYTPTKKILLPANEKSTINSKTNSDFHLLREMKRHFLKQFRNFK